MLVKSSLVKAGLLPRLSEDMIPVYIEATPEETETRNPAEIWQYRNKACALDLFLYRVGNGAAYSVRHFETRVRGPEKITAKACFAGLLQEHENRPPG